MAGRLPIRRKRIKIYRRSREALDIVSGPHRFSLKIDGNTLEVLYSGRLACSLLVEPHVSNKVRLIASKYLDIRELYGK